MEPGENARTKKEKKTGWWRRRDGRWIEGEDENEKTRTRGAFERGGKIREERGNERELFSRVQGSSMGGVKMLQLRQ